MLIPSLFQKIMGGKLLGLSEDKMAASPANKMAAPRPGDKGAEGSDLSCLTGNSQHQALGRLSPKENRCYLTLHIKGSRTFRV